METVDKFERAKLELEEVNRSIDNLMARRDALANFIALGDSLFTSPPDPAPAQTRAAQIALLRKSIAPAPTVPETRKTSVAEMVSAIKESTKQDRIIGCAMQLIGMQGAPVPTREIVKYALVHGINVTGKDLPAKVLTVSAILSKSKAVPFKSIPGQGWTIDTETKEKAPNDGES